MMRFIVRAERQCRIFWRRIPFAFITTIGLADLALAQSVQFDSGTMEITVKANKTLGAGFGHLASDRVNVTVTLKPPKYMELVTKIPEFSKVEDNSGRMLWKRGEFSASQHVFLTEGYGLESRPDHAVRFYGKVVRKAYGSGEPPDFRTSIADMDIDADTLGKREGMNWPPSRGELEDLVETIDCGGLRLPSDLWVGALPGSIVLEETGFAKDLAFHLRTAWRSTKDEPSVLGAWRCRYPGGVAVYGSSGARLILDHWYDVLPANPERQATFHVLTNSQFDNVGHITVEYRWHGTLRHGAVSDQAAMNAPYGAHDWIRVVPEGTAELRFIRQDNSLFPLSEDGGNDACHMVSKRKTDEDFTLGTVSFAGMVGGTPDPDTFRVEVRGLPAGLQPVPAVRVFVARQGRVVYDARFDTAEGDGDDAGVYRMDKLVRLVGTAEDCGWGGQQTPRVRLADSVYAMLEKPPYAANVQLEVGRPPSEDGSNAIRTVDVRYLVIAGAEAGDVAMATQWLSDTYAQAGVRFRLAGTNPTTVTPVNNILTVQRTSFQQSGAVSVKATRPGGQITANIQVTTEDNSLAIAQKLAAALGQGVSACWHQDGGDGEFVGAIVLADKGHNVTFDIFRNDIVAEVTVHAPTMSFPINDVTLGGLELASLALNFKDADHNTIDVFVVGEASPKGNAGLAGGRWLSEDRPAMYNVAFVQSNAVFPTGGGGADNVPPMTHAYLLPHEVGHVVLNGGNEIHVDDLRNMMFSMASNMDAVNSTKRLNPAQHDRVRSQNDPGLLKHE